MQPLILDGLKRMIAAIKDIDPLKPDLASLFLFGFFTESRANACTYISETVSHDNGDVKQTVHVDIHHVKEKPGFVFESALEE